MHLLPIHLHLMALPHGCLVPCSFAAEELHRDDLTPFQLLGVGLHCQCGLPLLQLLHHRDIDHNTIDDLIVLRKTAVEQVMMSASHEACGVSVRAA